MAKRDRVKFKYEDEEICSNNIRWLGKAYYRCETLKCEFMLIDDEGEEDDEDDEDDMIEDDEDDMSEDDEDEMSEYNTDSDREANYESYEGEEYDSDEDDYHLNELNAAKDTKDFDLSSLFLTQDERLKC